MNVIYESHHLDGNFKVLNFDFISSFVKWFFFILKFMISIFNFQSSNLDWVKTFHLQ